MVMVLGMTISENLHIFSGFWKNKLISLSAVEAQADLLFFAYCKPTFFRGYFFHLLSSSTFCSDLISPTAILAYARTIYSNFCSYHLLAKIAKNKSVYSL